MSKGVFTPDANDTNKSREVWRLNILSLLASRHGRGFCQAAPVSLQNVFLFL